MTDGGRNPYAPGPGHGYGPAPGYGPGYGHTYGQGHPHGPGQGHPHGPAWAPRVPGAGVPPQPAHPPAFPPRTGWTRFREGDWPPFAVLLRRVRLHGCAWALMLVCLWPVLLPVVWYPLARVAARQAHRRFPVQAYPRVVDPFMKRVQDARAWTALAASFLILVVYGADQDLADLQAQYFLRVTTTPWLVLLTAPLIVLVVFRLAPPSARPFMRSSLAATGRAALWYFGAFTAVPLLFAGMVVLGELYEPLRPLFTIGLLVPAVWTLLYVVFASLTLVPSVFGLSRVHAALPALVTGVLVWELAAVSLAFSGMPPGPLPVQLGAVVGGPVSVTAIAWWELTRLRDRYGVRLRARAG
ncbi:hypothetical protein ACFVU3_03695 [Streptomyces sp. NPDC058052]|uniref:hypothetical protein n=1 Tax=Streptomyces sp. NPDC058052 TaxID=3346316 RepID=UPI0036E6F1D8